MTIASFIDKHFYPNFVIQLISGDTWFPGKIRIAPNPGRVTKLPIKPFVRVPEPRQIDFTENPADGRNT